MANAIVKEYLINIKDSYRNKSNPLGDLYRLQKTIGNEKNSRLNSNEKSDLLNILDSSISLVEYKNIKNDGTNFGGGNDKIYLGDVLKSLYDSSKYFAKNKILPATHEIFKIIYGLNKHPSELNYNRKYDNIIKDKV